MAYRLLGGTGVKVSALCFGTMTFGDADESSSAALFARCRDIGARTVSQLEPSLRSVEVRLTPEEWAEIADLVPHPGVATDRTEDLVGIGFAPGPGDPGGPPGRSR
jgi:aryl-alcohol dehydrogenase-like predicted oxidoreductase